MEISIKRMGRLISQAYPGWTQREIEHYIKVLMEEGLSKRRILELYGNLPIA